MTRTKASIQAQERYDQKAYDRILIRLPKGTKASIQASGETVNGFITKAVFDRLQKLDIDNNKTGE